MTTLGVESPEEVNVQKLEKSTTNKNQIINELKKSFKAVNTFVADIPEGEYDIEVDFFGMNLTKLDMIFSAATHQWEILGQAIAYSRTNDIVPPWSSGQ